MIARSKFTFYIVLVVATVLPSYAAQTNGLCLASSGKKSDLRVLQAYVYSQDNANSTFAVNLTTSAFQEDPQTHELTDPVILRIGGRDYHCNGWGGSGWGGPKSGAIYNMFFNVTNQDDAEAAAKLFSTTCHLRSPPGYKLLAQFVPSKSAFNRNEPIIVTFCLKNLDERTILFPRDAPASDNRDEQYGFQATLYGRPVPDIGGEDWTRPLSYISMPPAPVSLAPGKTFEEHVDLKKWFAFDKTGEYDVHGFCRLDFYPPVAGREALQPMNELWCDYASADFSIAVK